MLPTSAGVEPATSWSPVGRRIQLGHRGQPFLSDNFHFLVVKFSVYLNRQVFLMLLWIFFFFIFCPICCFIVMFSGYRLILWSPCWDKGSWCFAFLWFMAYVLSVFITKTCLFKCIVNFTSKNWQFSEKKNPDIFHISAQNIDCGYSLEPPRWGGSNEYPQSMFLSRNKNNNVHPCKPQFYYIKVGFKGVKII